ELARVGVAQDLDGGGLCGAKLGGAGGVVQLAMCGDAEDRGEYQYGCGRDQQLAPDPEARERRRHGAPSSRRRESVSLETSAFSRPDRRPIVRIVMTRGPHRVRDPEDAERGYRDGDADDLTGLERAQGDEEASV